MSDAKLRALERAWHASGEEADQLAYLQAGLRAEVLTRERLELAVFLGDRSAWIALGNAPDAWTHKPQRKLKQAFKDLSAWGLEMWIQGFASGARALLPTFELDDPEVLDEVEPALAAAEAWAATPGAEPRERAAAAARALEPTVPPSIGGAFRGTPESGEQCARLLAWRVADWTGRGERGDPVDLAEAVAWAADWDEARLVREILERLVAWVLGSGLAEVEVADANQLAWARHYQAKRTGTLRPPPPRSAFHDAIEEILGPGDFLDVLRTRGQQACVLCTVLIAEQLVPVWSGLLPAFDWPQRAVEAARGWLSCPCEEHAEAAARSVLGRGGSARLAHERRFDASNNRRLWSHHDDLLGVLLTPARAVEARRGDAAAVVLRAARLAGGLLEVLPSVQGWAIVEGFQRELGAWALAQEA